VNGLDGLIGIDGLPVDACRARRDAVEHRQQPSPALKATEQRQIVPHHHDALEAAAG
jgi:hypothetical protein